MWVVDFSLEMRRLCRTLQWGPAKTLEMETMNKDFLKGGNNSFYFEREECF